MEQSISNKILSLTGLVTIFISGIILFIWKRADTLHFLQQLFTVEYIGTDLVLGLIGSLVLLILLGALIVTKKAHLPNTNGVNDLVNILHTSKSSIYTISILTVAGEELLFRGVLLLMLTAFLPGWLSVLLITIVFTAMHYKNQYEGQPYLLGYLCIMSLITGFITVEQQTLWSALMIHAVSNFVTSILIKRNIIKVEAALPASKQSIEHSQ
ncbi:CPBP family intramembrane glutamic endopeptidase [Paenibacillus sp. FSL W7-1287]|uniref:CPBP family intramembrane glutamic endopeptidase n=1 Tax=Paenibacillus sp. FSL W7-1287 TaxID=2954538 RepID=UPI0030F9D8A3